MKHVFISYRHVEPDQSLAHGIADHIAKHGLHVFVDIHMMVGTKWVEEIERQILGANYFVVLLSKESIRSDMVRREVKLAYELSRKPESPLVILPVRVAFKGELPYDLGSYLDTIQYAFWKDGEPFEPVYGQITAAIGQSVALPNEGKKEQEAVSISGIQELANETERVGAPLPAADPRFALDTGAVKLRSPFYVRRKADSAVEEEILGDGTTTIVKGPRQMGKSSLLARAHAEARGKQRKAYYLDFQSIGTSELNDLASLLKLLAQKVSNEFKTTAKPDKRWKKNLPAIDNLTSFIQDEILAAAQSPVLFLFDEVDRIFPFPYRDDFFAMIRAWHNSRATNDLWNRLNFIIAHATEPYMWIQNLNQSPFNVGRRVELEDFTLDQVSDLNTKHGNLLRTDEERQDLLNLTAGHPYLVRQSFYALKVNHWDMPNLKENATSDTGPFGDHLRQWLWYFHEYKELKSSLRQVLKRGQCKDEIHFLSLKAAGLVRGHTRNAVKIRCALYEAYLAKHL